VSFTDCNFVRNLGFGKWQYKCEEGKVGNRTMYLDCKKANVSNYLLVCMYVSSSTYSCERKKAHKNQLSYVAPIQCFA
jgi:hypothetical protein